METIRQFITRFAGAEDVFLNGCCYWFAYILKGRFGGTIVYAPIEGHFLLLKDGRFWDVAGEQAEPLSWYTCDWLYDNEPEWFDRLKKYCINMED